MNQSKVELRQNKVDSTDVRSERGWYQHWSLFSVDTFQNWLAANTVPYVEEPEPEKPKEKPVPAFIPDEGLVKRVKDAYNRDPTPHVSNGIRAAIAHLHDVEHVLFTPAELKVIKREVALEAVNLAILRCVPSFKSTDKDGIGFELILNLGDETVLREMELSE